MASIKTELWKTTDQQEWQQKYRELAWIIGLLATINLTINIYNGELVRGTVNAIMLVFAAIIQISYNKYQKEKEK